MGYYTRHELEVLQGDDDKTDYKKEIGETTDYGSSIFEEDIKWSDHEDHMRKYSLKHPQTVFALKGEGEEAGDIWIEYYKNGKMQRCKAEIRFSDYDESLLE